MKLFSIFATIILSVLLLGITSKKIYAQTKVLKSTSNTFDFSTHVSDIYVGEVKVFQENVDEYIPSSTIWDANGMSSRQVPARFKDNHDRARIIANVGFPSCGNHYHIEGHLTISYQNDDASITRTYYLTPADEGETRDIEWSLNGYYGQPSNGHAQIKGLSTCVHH